MRLTHRDVSSLLTVAAVVFAIVAIFPFEAFDFRARSVSAARPYAAFVTLSDAATAAAVRSAKSRFGGSPVGAGRLRADISFGELPEERPTPVLDVASHTRPPAAPLADRGLTSYLPSLAAPPPRKLRAEKDADDGLTFSKQELLKID